MHAGRTGGGVLKYRCSTAHGLKHLRKKQLKQLINLYKRAPCARAVRVAEVVRLRNERGAYLISFTSPPHRPQPHS